MILKSNFANFSGMEFATFKLKHGVEEKTLLELVEKLEQRFLSNQEELYMHCLLKGPDGLYADVAIGSTQAKVEEYCHQWLSNPDALKLIDVYDESTVNMTFLTKIN